MEVAIADMDLAVGIGSDLDPTELAHQTISANNDKRPDSAGSNATQSLSGLKDL